LKRESGGGGERRKKRTKRISYALTEGEEVIIVKNNFKTAQADEGKVVKGAREGGDGRTQLKARYWEKKLVLEHKLPTERSAFKRSVRTAKKGGKSERTGLNGLGLPIKTGRGTPDLLRIRSPKVGGDEQGWLGSHRRSLGRRLCWFIRMRWELFAI